MISTRRTTAAIAAAIALVVTLAAACVPPTTPPAGGPTVTVTPSSGLAANDASVTITGEGFNPAGFGIYVAVGPKRADFSTNAGNYQVVKWVWANPSGSAGQAKLEADGSFSVAVGVDATYTDGNGNAVDCRVDQCQVLTFAAHGSTDRSQDTFTPVSFA